MTIKWDGTQWTLVASPNGPSEDNYLYGVDKVASNNVWAVGELVETLATSSTALLLNWNGTSWSTSPSPNPGMFNKLTGVTAISSSDVWAVGIQYSGQPDSQRTLALHWNGTNWSTSSVPNYGYRR